MASAPTLVVLIAIAIMLVPVYLLPQFTGRDGGNRGRRQERQHPCSAAADSVADWPVIGKRVHAFWTQASTDLTGLTQKFAPQIKAFSLAGWASWPPPASACCCSSPR